MNSKGEPKEDEHHCIPLCACVCVCVYCVRERVCEGLYVDVGDCIVMTLSMCM